MKSSLKESSEYIVGIDEVGRGPIAGPVTFCIFAMKREVDILSLFKGRKLKDSKKLSTKRRQEIYSKLQSLKKEGLVDYCLVSHSAKQIDALGLSRITRKSIDKGLYSLSKKNVHLHKTYIYLDGGLTLKMSDHESMQLGYETVIKGDEKIEAIACASIIAKVSRDTYMQKLSRKSEMEDGVNYQWHKNVGYGTHEHYEAIEEYGLTEHHRRSFMKEKGGSTKEKRRAA